MDDYALNLLVNTTLVIADEFFYTDIQCLSLMRCSIKVIVSIDNINNKKKLT